MTTPSTNNADSSSSSSSLALLEVQVEEQLRVSSSSSSSKCSENNHKSPTPSTGEENHHPSSLGISDGPPSEDPTNAIIQSAKNNPSLIICDAGYGLPREARPRKEKILAIARQLVNFLEWQQADDQQEQCMAHVQVVACSEESVREALEERTLSLLGGGNKKVELPRHVSFSCKSLEETCQEILRVHGGAVPIGADNEDDNKDADDEHEIYYLSPDAKESLDPCEKPPRVVVVGLLIDRRIQPNRSHDRASKLKLVAKRWPLEDCFAGISANEPLNVDCILEGMQQWWWNNSQLEQKQRIIDEKVVARDVRRETFMQAASQAIQHHAERHPARPVHLQS